MKLKWVLIVALCVVALPAWANSIQIAIISQGVTADALETNTVAIAPGSSLWQTPSGGASWVTDAVTASGIQKTNGTTSTFTQSFFLPYGTNTGSVTVWADDTARVWLNNTLIFDFFDGPNSTCQMGVIGCLPQFGGTVSLDGLNAGTHVLTVEALQTNGGPFGALWIGSVTSVPDGGMTLMLLGGALIGLETLRRKLRV